MLHSHIQSHVGILYIFYTGKQGHVKIKSIKYSFIQMWMLVHSSQVSLTFQSNSTEYV